MTGTVTTERPWVQEMVVVHRIFRRESRHLHDLIGAVRPGDTARAGLLAGLAREYIEGLHNHHTSEDELLWPKLLARVDLDAELVLRMEQQHQVVDAGLRELERLLAAWAGTPAEPQRDALVGALAQHRRDLLEHLDEEERHVLPLIEEHLTVAEWNALGEHARSKTPKEKQLLMLGALLEDATPEETARFMARLPFPVRLLWKTVGRRSYNKQMAAVRTP
ncbi:hemerythrin domain-containing protein [Dactylosporangium sp. NPDC051541]|uniref:hemerythrin domain-containing protein n=1 Tax=Dactylosporangium sp. NPDC051541 TaxID=3363977 RepID=UPI0037956449